MEKNVQDKILTGVIQTKNGNVVFHGQGYQFTFVNPEMSGKKLLMEVDENGYIWGRTYDHKVIAIYARQDIEVTEAKVLNTWTYVISRYGYVSRDTINIFDGIRFKNGVIRTIYPCNALHEDYEKSEGNTLVYNISNDIKRFEFNKEDETICWKFGSEINQKVSIKEGSTLSNCNAILDILFDEQQGYKTFYDYYGYICDFCSFITFRSRVGFEKIFLLRKRDDNINEAVAECYVKTESKIEERDFVHIIPVASISQSVFDNIFKNILKTDKKHKGLPAFIAPKDNEDARIMEVGKIRNICSALEMELDLEGVRLKPDENMRTLISAVKLLVKEHRDGETPLSPKSYEYIFGNIAHWDQPLVERLYIAWEQHEEEMQPILQLYGVDIDITKIQAFVSARNAITHNGFSGMDEDVANTAFILNGFVYCCALTRLGMKKEEIKDIMSRRVFC